LASPIIWRSPRPAPSGRTLVVQRCLVGIGVKRGEEVEKRRGEKDALGGGSWGEGGGWRGRGCWWAPEWWERGAGMGVPGEALGCGERGNQWWGRGNWRDGEGPRTSWW
jgi:hypothetical protein